MNEQKLGDNNHFAVSISLLYEGMIVEEDVYDADATHMLVARGTVINSDTIGRIKSINAGRDTIQVSGNTYRTITAKRGPVETIFRKAIEEATGYTAATDVTFKMLDEISRHQSVKQDALYEVSVELSNRLEATSPSTIISLINALAPVDEYLQRHCVNVGMLNGLFGRWLNLPKADVDKLVLMGLLHDCGKALVPSQILNASRRLTMAEFEVIKMHTLYGYELLAGFPEPVRQASRGHHEKVGGIGYPDRLHPDSISMEARITAVSDIYDAMVSQRAYKKPRSPFSIMAVIMELSGSELDSRLVQLFINNMPNELMNKQVLMCDGMVGIVRSVDVADIEYPFIEVNGRITKSNQDWYCTSMYTEA